MRGNSIQAVMQMQIVRPSYTRILKLRSWTKGKQNALVEILDPPKETGTASLRNSNEMWNYLPKTDSVIRVPGSMMLQSWMGSDFTNDDLVNASSLVRDYHHKIVKYRGKGKNRQVLIQCIPKQGAPVVWGKIMHWARLSDHLPVKQKYYDDRGRLARGILYSNYRRMDERTIPTKITVINARAKGERTVVSYSKVLFDRALGQQTFSRHRLKQNVETGKNLARAWVTRRMYGSAPKTMVAATR